MGFPIVPVGPGVPALSPFVTIAQAVGLLLADTLSLGADNSQQWGLFLDSEPVITAESVIAFDFKHGYSISKFAIEPAGTDQPASLASYNKVQHPFDVMLQFATGDTPAARQQLLNSAEAACASLQLMDAVTPEKTYANLNPINYSYRRTAHRGLTLIVLDLHCEQVRITASSTFTNAQQSTGNTTADNTTVTPASDSFAARYNARIDQPLNAPSASPAVNSGTVQGTPAQQSAASSVLSQSMLPF